MPFMTSAPPDQLPFWNTWHQTRGATGDDPRHRELRDAFLEQVTILDRPQVVDLGCGQGHDVAAFADAGCVVSGLDFSWVAVEQARRVLPSPERHRITVGNLQDPLPYGDHCFDGVYSHLALHYFDDKTTREIFSEIWRITKPGGVFVFSVKSTADPYYSKGEKLADGLFVRNGHLRHFFDETYLKDLLDDWDDLRVIESNAYGCYASRKPSAFLRAVVRKP